MAFSTLPVASSEQGWCFIITQNPDPDKESPDATFIQQFRDFLGRVRAAAERGLHCVNQALGQPLPEVEGPTHSPDSMQKYMQLLTDVEASARLTRPLLFTTDVSLGNTLLLTCRSKMLRLFNSSVAQLAGFRTQPPAAEQPAPRPQAPAPRPQAPAPRPQAPAPRPQAPAPRPQAPAPRPQAPAPRPQAPAAHELLEQLQSQLAGIAQQPSQQPSTEEGVRFGQSPYISYPLSHFPEAPFPPGLVLQNQALHKQGIGPGGGLGPITHPPVHIPAPHPQSGEPILLPVYVLCSPSEISPSVYRSRAGFKLKPCRVNRYNSSIWLESLIKCVDSMLLLILAHRFPCFGLPDAPTVVASPADKLEFLKALYCQFHYLLGQFRQAFPGNDKYPDVLTTVHAGVLQKLEATFSARLIRIGKVSQEEVEAIKESIRLAAQNKLRTRTPEKANDEQLSLEAIDQSCSVPSLATQNKTAVRRSPTKEEFPPHRYPPVAQPLAGPVVMLPQYQVGRELVGTEGTIVKVIHTTTIAVNTEMFIHWDGSQEEFNKILQEKPNFQWLKHTLVSLCTAAAMLAESNAFGFYGLSETMTGLAHPELSSAGCKRHMLEQVLLELTRCDQLMTHFFADYRPGFENIVAKAKETVEKALKKVGMSQEGLAALERALTTEVSTYITNLPPPVQHPGAGEGSSEEVAFGVLSHSPRSGWSGTFDPQADPDEIAVQRAMLRSLQQQPDDDTPAHTGLPLREHVQLVITPEELITMLQQQQETLEEQQLAAAIQASLTEGKPQKCKSITGSICSIPARQTAQDTYRLPQITSSPVEGARRPPREGELEARVHHIEMVNVPLTNVHAHVTTLAARANSLVDNWGNVDFFYQTGQLHTSDLRKLTESQRTRQAMSHLFIFLSHLLHIIKTLFGPQYLDEIYPLIRRNQILAMGILEEEVGLTIEEAEELRDFADQTAGNEDVVTPPVDQRPEALDMASAVVLSMVGHEEEPAEEEPILIETSSSDESEVTAVTKGFSRKRKAEPSSSDDEYHPPETKGKGKGKGKGAKRRAE